MTSATSGSCAGSRGPPRLQLRERPREVHVAEDASGLVTLVRAADEDRVGVLADEIEAVEILDHRRHRQRDHAPAVQQAHRCCGRRLQLVAGDVDAEPPQLRDDRRARPDCHVRDEPKPVAALAQRRDRLRRAGDRFAGDVEHAVDVQENGGHGTRVYGHR